MAGDEKAKTTTFPVVPTAHWWALRKKFQQSIPGVVTANYIASVLNMQEGSARANVLGGLRLTGIVDKEGRTGDRAKQWRDDEQYGATCKEIINDCYPQELRDAFPNPAQDRNGVARWFANHTGGGEAAVEKFVKFYLLLDEADATKGTAAVEKKAERAKQQPSPKPQRRAAAATVGATTPGAAAPAPAQHERTPIRSNHADGPAVHINLQVHISSDASTDQIEQVFASMAKHIYQKASE